MNLYKEENSVDILHLNGTFGRLEHDELTLSPGLNLLYAPNESGKSTWGTFIRTMLYGLSTRERGPLADKNRYAPWSGAPLRGRMDVAAGDDTYTLLRETRRAAAPMGEFSCTYTGTATPVPNITGQNAGEMLLGVPREVFERSAFIGQNALTVEQDAELERRIAALITTGEEDTSYTESCDRLKKQLNRRRHNKTGLIPALERDIDQLQGALRELDALTDQAQQSRRELDALEHRAADLQQQADRWQTLAQQERVAAYRQAEQAALAAQAKADALADQCGALPDDAALALLEGQAAALPVELSALTEKRRAAEESAAAAQQAQERWQQHSLYPAGEVELRQKADAIVPEKSPTLFLPIFSGALIPLCVTLAFLLRSKGALPFWLFIGMAGLGVIATLFAVKFRRQAIVERRKYAETRCAALETQIDEYLPLRQQAEDAAESARRAQVSAADGEDSCRRRLRELLTQVRVYAPSVTDLTGAQLALADIRRRRAALADARQQAREAALYRDALRRQLTEQELSAPADAAVPSPTISRQQAADELARVQELLTQERTRSDTLTGRIRSLDRSSDLEAQLAQKQEQLAALQAEYDAIALAMDVLSQANTVLQNRFSPALGARAAEIFSHITGGRYDKVLLSRDFSLSAEPAGDPVGRSVRLLSQGAADQLYLAVRLAICDMVLPADRRVPLILDDALVTFDDDRLHAALDYLLDESRNRQILLFTCQKRETAYLQGRENVTVTCL
mgnify:FL=1